MSTKLTWELNTEGSVWGWPPDWDTFCVAPQGPVCCNHIGKWILGTVLENMIYKMYCLSVDVLNNANTFNSNYDI